MTDLVEKKLKHQLERETRRRVAFKIMRHVISALRTDPDIDSTDVRYLLCTKYFLYYLFDENPLKILGTIHKEKCVICTRGKKKRLDTIQLLLNNADGNDDQRHEVDFLRSRLQEDMINDTVIMIPASICVRDKKDEKKDLCELDGLIIYPMRNENQIVFLEAKNKNMKPAKAKNCLMDKFNKLNINYDRSDIKTEGYDAYWKYTI